MSKLREAFPGAVPGNSVRKPHFCRRKIRAPWPVSRRASYLTAKLEWAASCCYHQPKIAYVPRRRSGGRITPACLDATQRKPYAICPYKYARAQGRA